MDRTHLILICTVIVEFMAVFLALLCEETFLVYCFLVIGFIFLLGLIFPKFNLKALLLITALFALFATRFHALSDRCIEFRLFYGRSYVITYYDDVGLIITGEQLQEHGADGWTVYGRSKVNRIIRGLEKDSGRRFIATPGPMPQMDKRSQEKFGIGPIEVPRNLMMEVGR